VEQSPDQTGSAKILDQCYIVVSRKSSRGKCKKADFLFLNRLALNYSTAEHSRRQRDAGDGQPVENQDFDAGAA
jgi:hypothetical protein